MYTKNRGSPICSTSTFIYCMKSLLLRRLKAYGWRGGKLAVRPSVLRRWTITSRLRNLPTINDPIAKKQITTLAKNCARVRHPACTYGTSDQGIVHIIGPELGLTQPGKTIVCGDSHTSTHGAFGAIAFGIGTSEVEHVLSTQTLWQSKPKTMEISNQREAWIWRYSERCHPCDHSEIWHRCWYWAYRGIYRRSDSLYDDGGTDDYLQYVH